MSPGWVKGSFEHVSPNGFRSLSSRYLSVVRYHLQQVPNLPRSILDSITSRLSTRWRSSLLYSLQRTARTFELDLDSIQPEKTHYLISSTTVSTRADIVIPASEHLTQVECHSWNPLRVHRLRDVVVDPDSGLIFAGDRVISQSAYGWRSASDGAFLSSASTRARKPKEGPPISAPIAPFGGAVYNYYHFLIETLPRILHIASVQPQVVITLTAPVPTHVEQILGLLRIDFRVVPPDSFHHSDVFVCDPVPFSWPHPSNIQMLHSLRVGHNNVNAEVPGRIYISRSGSGRQLAEESRLEEFLCGYGYTTFRLEELSWLDQISMFRNVDSVIAPHGAGLSNIAFMKPGSEVFEISTGSWWFPCFRNLAHIAHVEHQLLTIPYSANAPHGQATDAIASLEQILGR